MSTKLSAKALFFKASPISLAVLTALGLSVSGVSIANEKTAKKEIEVIQVTSRQRSENVQNVPIAITTFGAQEIEDLGIERAGDFIALTPNMTMVESQNAGTSFITIRGLSQVRNGESPVAISVDGVLQISPNQFNQDLFDIEQIEILKGPQGALYGRNAIGGAINITTQKPSDELTGYTELDFGNGGFKTLTGALSGPVSETLSYRVTASYKEYDGLIENVYLKQKVDFNKDQNVRARILWQPSDSFTADLRLGYGKTDGGAVNFIYQPLFSVNDANDTSIKIEANNPGQNDRKIGSSALKLDWDIDLGTATFIVAKDTVTEYLAGDQFPYSRNISATSPFGANVFDGVQTQFLDVDATSYELRFTSDGEQDLRWIAGVYWLQTDRFISTTSGQDLGKGIARIERQPLPNSAISPTETYLADDNDNTAKAAFVQFNYSIDESQELSLSGRYDIDKRRQTNRATSDFDSNAGEIRATEFKKFQPKISYIYTGLDNLSLYGNYSEGFRSGGFNQSGVGASAADLGLDGVSDLYLAEETTNYELGIKGLYPQHATRFNASLFNTTIDNQHYFVFVGALGSQVLVNVDEVNLLGGEFEFKTALSDSIDVYGGFGITDSEVKAYALDPSNVGNKAAYVPDYTINLGAQFSSEIISGWLSTMTIDWERRGQQFWDPANSSARDAINLVNMRLGFNNDQGDWSVNLWAQNLLNEDYNAEWVLGGFSHPGAQRTFGLEVRWAME